MILTWKQLRELEQQMIDDQRREWLTEVIARFQRKTHAEKELGITRSQMNDMLKRYNMSFPDQKIPGKTVVTLKHLAAIEGLNDEMKQMYHQFRDMNMSHERALHALLRVVVTKEPQGRKEQPKCQDAQSAARYEPQPY